MQFSQILKEFDVKCYRSNIVSLERDHVSNCSFCHSVIIANRLNTGAESDSF